MLLAEVLMTAASCRLLKTLLPTKLICRTVVFLTFRYLVDEIHTVVAPLDDLRRHADIIAP